MPAHPRVSIGLPVYNGELFLENALDSILSQTYSDFELIISDNASDDKTEEICRSYAARDKRVRYSRNAHNLGAAPNYNRVYHLARGRYFKWASHDDVLAPEFLISLFLGEGEMETSSIALEFIAWFWPAFLFNGMNITIASYFTALHKPLQSAAIAVSRSLVLPVAGLLLLPGWLGDHGVYLSIPIAEAITFVLALVLVAIYRPSNIVQ